MFLNVSGSLPLPDVLGQDGDAAPDADRGERLADQVEVRVGHA